jgi:hypothetical protein
MTEIQFNRERVPARKDLLHFVEENLNPKIYSDLGENPARWIEELNMINLMLTGDSLINGSGLELVPLGFCGMQQLGENVFLYRGTENRRVRGVWILDEKTWNHYRLGAIGKLFINQEFADISSEEFLPDNFEKKSTVVKSDKRPIQVFEADREIGKITIYAKGSVVNPRFLYTPPSFRLTNLSGVDKITSQTEMDMSLKLAKHGVKVPTIIGYYESVVEEFLFLQSVEGNNPSEYFGTHRKEIIEQDARMLAAFCLLGLNKCGFTDFDDKVFDGKDLYLIDTEEISDLYFPSRPDFKQMLINPIDTAELEKFRQFQDARFRTMLSDALYRYKDSLTPALEDCVLYTNTFLKKIGKKPISDSEVQELTTFPRDYQTWDSYMGMMCDTD